MQGVGETVGAGLVAHPEVNAISFIGSVATGSRIQAAADARVKRVRIVEQSRDMRLGSGFDPETQMGPVVSADQLERVQRSVAIGPDEGAELALGARRYGDVGFFVRRVRDPLGRAPTGHDRISAGGRRPRANDRGLPVT